MQTLFFIVAAVLFYVYAGYPFLLLLLSFLWETRLKVGDVDLPRMAVLIPAHNEAANIRRKIENTFANDYPADRIEVIAGADACTDSTLAELKKIEDSRLRVVEFKTRAGKSAVLSRIAELTQAEVLVISDADVTIHSGALRLLAAHFADPHVGAVCGRRSHHEAPLIGMRAPARLYNLYESAIKRGEGRLHRVLGADGSLYAVRKSLFQPIPANVPDDFVAVLRVLAASARVIYENEAVSRENLAADSAYQFTRKRRTVARGVRGMWLVKNLLNPFRFPLIAFLMFSHKILRWCTPILLAMLFIASAVLSHNMFFKAALLLQILFYLFAWAGASFKQLRSARIFQAARYFVVVNAATAAGLWDVAAMRTWSAWETQAESGAL